MQPRSCSSSRLEMATIWRPLVQSAFGKKMALRFPFYLLPNIFSHNYSKSQWNLTYYGTFSIYIELSCDLVQPGPCSSSRLEMAAKRRLLVQSGFGKNIAQKVWNNITPEYLRSLNQSMPQRMQAVVDAQGGHTKYMESLWYIICTIRNNRL